MNSEEHKRFFNLGTMGQLKEYAKLYGKTNVIKDIKKDNRGNLLLKNTLMCKEEVLASVVSFINFIGIYNHVNEDFMVQDVITDGTYNETLPEEIILDDPISCCCRLPVGKGDIDAS